MCVCVCFFFGGEFWSIGDLKTKCDLNPTNGVFF